MSKPEEKPSTPPTEPPPPVVPTPPTADERRNACGAAIEAALQTHRCNIVPRLDAEPVGETGAKAIVQAVWTLVPAEG